MKNGLIFLKQKGEAISIERNFKFFVKNTALVGCRKRKKFRRLIKLLVCECLSNKELGF